MEVTPGRIVAASYAIGANVVFFIAIGLLAAAAARHRTALFSLYLVMSVLICFLALWGAGFSLAFLNGFALLAALFLYATPVPGGAQALRAAPDLLPVTARSALQRPETALTRARRSG